MLKRVVLNDDTETTTRLGKRNYCVKDGIIYMMKPMHNGYENNGTYELHPIIYREKKEIWANKIMNKQQLLEEMDIVYSTEANEDIVNMIKKVLKV